LTATTLLHHLCNPLRRRNLHSWPVQDASSSILPFLSGQRRIYTMNQVLGHLMLFCRYPSRCLCYPAVYLHGVYCYWRSCGGHFNLLETKNVGIGSIFLHVHLWTAFFFDMAGLSGGQAGLVAFRPVYLTMHATMYEIMHCIRIGFSALAQRTTLSSRIIIR
jgi:hypothetical protein